LAKQAEKIYLSQGEIKYAILAYLLLRDKPKNASDIQLYCLQRKREDRIDRKKEGVLHTQAAACQASAPKYNTVCFCYIFVQYKLSSTITVRLIETYAKCWK
jgi:hypothetical protein